MKNQEICYLQDVLTSQLFHHLDVISCEDQTYFLHILVQWQPKTNDTYTCYKMWTLRKNGYPCYVHVQNIDTQARQKYFFVNKKPLEVVNSRWCYQSGPLKVIGQFSLNGIGCKTF